MTKLKNLRWLTNAYACLFFVGSFFSLLFVEEKLLRDIKDRQEKSNQKINDVSTGNNDISDKLMNN